MLERHAIPPVRSAMLYPRVDAEAARLATRDAARWLDARGVKVFVPHSVVDAGVELPDSVGIVEAGELVQDVELMIALGGDGTLLRASRWVADHGIPVMGVNLGDLGFLSAFSSGQLEEALAAAVEGTLVWEPRERMRVDVRRAGAVQTSETACNDAYIAHGIVPRMLQLVTTVGGHPMASYRADGLIVSTPMGSTAYNLSAGGPIVAPGTRTFTITPICPHSLTHRPVVLSATSPIVIEYSGPRDAGTASLTVDGQWNVALEVGDHVEISLAARPLRLVPPHASVFDVLATKLGWSRPDRGVV